MNTKAGIGTDEPKALGLQYVETRQQRNAPFLINVTKPSGFKLRVARQQIGRICAATTVAKGAVFVQ